MRKHPITGGKKMHKGTDWAAPKNTPVVSMLDGTVTYAGNQGGKTGYVVKIKDESGRETKFFHLNPGSLKVKKGQKVKSGAARRRCWKHRRLNGLSSACRTTYWWQAC